MARPTQWLSRLLPAPLHSKLEQAAFARDRAKRARKLSTGSKRLDLCAAQVAMLLHLAGQTNKRPLRGKRCLEVGSGWVPSYAVICHLLGAESFVATDIAPFILPGELRYALHESRLSNIRDVLAPFEDHCLIRERLDALLAVEDFTFDTLKSIGFEYIAPIDVARTRPDVEADVALSFSVLEHVPAEDIVPLLQNLADCLTPGGQMIHCVHLEDHKSTRKTPFKFLTLSRAEYPRELEIERGNRVRWSQWEECLSQVEGMDFDILYKWSREDVPLPSPVDPSVRHTGEADIRISHFGLHGTKKPTG